FQNYPNPFNPSTTIRFSIINPDVVKIKIYDVLGREVKTLVNEFKQAGTYEIQFNASSLASGIYLYRIESGNFVQTKKMILLK
ncbi:MAG: T9SS type A sorting domain-containing protein, partial [Ignavibacteriaceae bacterium]|nr:T9SS type A sorting domain-containing protein [Ignavibacteriaceae bacterium]